MKKVLRVAIVILLLTTMAIAATACQKKDVKAIRIDSDGLPARTTFVQGQEPDLFGGTLTVEKRNGDIEWIDLDSSDIILSDYDVNKLGNQNLKISYMGQSTTLPITYVKRLAIQTSNENFKTYFIGEPFNPGDATVVLTNDDGSTNTIRLDSEDVTLSGYDNTVVGTQTIHLSYRGYEDTFDVNVYEPDGGKPTFQRPDTRLYGSHIKQLDLGGGSIIYKHGSVEKYVTITQDMIDTTSYNFSKVNMANNRGDGKDGYESQKTSKQTVKLSYGGYDFSYDIEVYFSDVAVIKLYANEYLSDIKWGGDIKDIRYNQDPNVPQDKLSVEAARLYFNLSDDDKAYVTPNELKYVMLMAAYSSYQNWLFCMQDKENGLGNVLTVGLNNGTVVLDIVCDDPIVAAASIEYINEHGDEMKSWNNLLWHILGDEELSQLVVFTSGGRDVTLKAAMGLAIEQKGIDGILDQLRHLIKLYDLLDGITIDDIPYGHAPDKEVRETIEDIISNYLLSPDGYLAPFRSIYSKLVSWRPDYFDVIYKYLYDRTLDGYEFESGFFKDVDSSDANALAKAREAAVQRIWLTIVELGFNIHLPTIVDNYYKAIDNALSQATDDTAISEKGAARDASNFYYFYFTMLELRDTIANLSDEEPLTYMYKGLVETNGYVFSIMVKDNEPINPMTITEGIDLVTKAMYSYNYTMLGISEFDKILQSYITIIKNYYNGLYREEVEVKDENDQTVYEEDGVTPQMIAKWNDAFVEDVSNFLYSFVNDYSENIQFNFLLVLFDADYMVLDIGVDSFSTFTSLLQAYFGEVLDDESTIVARNLLRAYECFLRKDNSRTYTLSKFLEYTYDALDPYLELTPAQQEPIKFLYDKIYYLYGLYGSNVNGTFIEPVLDDEGYWQGRFEEVAERMGELYILSTVIFDNMYNVVIGPYLALYENVTNELLALRAEIDAVEDKELKVELEKAYYYVQYELLPSNTVGMKRNLDSMFYVLRVNYMACMVDMGVLYWGQQVALYETVYQADGSVLYNSVYDNIKDIIVANYDFFVPYIETMYKVGLSNGIDFTPYKTAEFTTYFEGVVDKFLDINNGWNLDQKALWMSIQAAQADAFYSSLIYYYSDKIGDDSNYGNKNNLTARFIDLVYSYIVLSECVEYLTVDDTNYLNARDNYKTAKDAFQKSYDIVKEANPDITAKFDAEFGKYVGEGGYLTELEF